MIIRVLLIAAFGLLLGIGCKRQVKVKLKVRTADAGLVTKTSTTP